MQLEGLGILTNSGRTHIVSVDGFEKGGGINDELVPPPPLLRFAQRYPVQKCFRWLQFPVLGDCYFLNLLYPTSPTKPAHSRNMVEGSGTGAG